MSHSKTLFITGYSRLPQGMAAQYIYEIFTVTLEIDHKYGVIIDADCTLATDLGKRFISQLLKGYSLNDGIDGLIEQVKQYYRGKAVNALIASLKDLDNQYQMILLNGL